MSSLDRLLAPERLALVLGALLLALAFPWRQNPFHLDDLNRVLDNPGIETVFPLSRHFLDPSTMSTRTGLVAYRPLLPLTLSFNHALHGYDPAGYHLANALLHALVALALALLVRELAATLADRPDLPAPGPRAAAAAALLFALHPLGGIPVHYVCTRDLQLALLFTLLGLVAHARMRRIGTTPAAAAALLACLVLGLLAKADAVALPGLMLAWDLVLRAESPRSPAPWLRAGAALALAALVVAFPVLALGSADLANTVQGDRSLASLARTASTQLRLHALHYPLALALPWRIRQAPAAQAVGFDDPGALAGLALLVASLALAFRLRATRPATAFALLAYWIAFAPSSSIVPLHPLAVDYRAIPSSAFAALLLVLELFPRLPAPARLPACLATAAALAACWTWQARLWTSPHALWAHSVTLGGDAMAWQGLALATDDQALRVELLDRALALQPGYSIAHTNRGLALLALGRREEGLEACRRGVETAPDRDNPHYWLGRAYLMVGSPIRALESFEAAIALSPGNREHRLRAAEAAFQLQDPAKARALLEPLVPADPAPAVLGAWGKALFLLGERDRGLRATLAAAAGLPDDVDLAWQAGTQLLAAGRGEEALPPLRRVADAVPAHPKARALVAFVLQSLRRPAQAVPEYRTHLEHHPGDQEARLNLVLALQALGRPCAETVPELQAILRAAPADPNAQRLLAACGPK